MTVQILVGDCRQTMAGLPAGFFHTCVSSPPYFGLRDYQTPPLSWPAISYSPLAGLPECVHIPAMECSLGLEPTLEAFIGHMVLVYREVRRVLRDDGTIWVNMGDSYAGARRGGSVGQDSSTLAGKQTDHSREARYQHQAFTEEQKDASLAGLRAMTPSRRRDDEPIPRSDLRIAGLKPKDMMGQPWRLAFALQADGWWLRSDVIWFKLNPMPESAKDRPTKAHEYFFLLSKSERYYYDADAIKEPASEDTHARYARNRSKDHKWSGDDPMPGQRQQTIAKGFEHMRKPVAGWATGQGDHSTLGHNQPDDERDGRKLLKVYPGTGVGFGHGYDANPKPRVRSAAASEFPGAAQRDPQSRRRKGAEHGSGIKSNDNFDTATVNVVEDRNKRSVWPLSTEAFPGAHFATFPTRLIEPCILAGCPPGGNVLDPFGGSGTTGVVADRHQRNATLCELNPEYAKLATARVTGDAPLFAEVSAVVPEVSSVAQQLELGGAHG